VNKPDLSVSPLWPDGLPSGGYPGFPAFSVAGPGATLGGRGRNSKALSQRLLVLAVGDPGAVGQTHTAKLLAPPGRSTPHPAVHSDLRGGES